MIVLQPGPFVLGSLFQQLSPLTDTGGEPRTNTFLWQYFINYNFGKGWALATAPAITANWDAPSGQRWTVPVGGGIQPMTLGFQYYYNVKHPDNSYATTLRFSVSFIFPEKRAQ